MALLVGWIARLFGGITYITLLVLVVVAVVVGGSQYQYEYYYYLWFGWLFQTWLNGWRNNNQLLVVSPTSQRCCKGE